MADDIDRSHINWEKRLGELRPLARMGFPATEIARKMAISATAVRAAVRRYSVPLDAKDHRSLMIYLNGGGYLLREDIPGIIGHRWTTPQRDGKEWNRGLCDELSTDGTLVEAAPGVWRTNIEPSSEGEYEYERDEA